MKRRIGWVAWSVGFIIFSTSLAALFFKEDPSVQTRGLSSIEPEEEFPHQVQKDSTLYDAFRELGMSPQDIHAMVKAARPYSDLSRVLPGMAFRVETSLPPVRKVSLIKFRFSPTEFLELQRGINSEWNADWIQETVEVRQVHFSGAVESSLWESAQQAKMDPGLIAELAEVFAWQVDFAREVQKGDRWRLSVEHHWVRSRPVGWGRILAAEYENAGQVYSAVLFRKDGKDLGYFAPDGSSLKRMFLKSPIRFGRISSRFRMNRFHPILHRNRPHLGVDYAAPTGTPIRAVGAGTVEFVGWKGGGGKVIRIRHNSYYKTAYKHLSGYAKSIRRGAKVEQGQVIGYVGSTGLSTGAHLHFEFFERGRFVDPLGRKFPSADPVPSRYLAEFQALAEIQLSGLPHWTHTGARRAVADLDDEGADPNLAID